MGGTIRRRNLSAIATLLLVAVWYALEGRLPDGETASGGDAVIERALHERAKNLWVETSGIVEEVLSDDREGSRHQRFILRLTSGRTLMVAHNIDLADRVPLREHDVLRLRGQYEWNDQGGYLHWTHRDAKGRRPGGWIEHRGRRYR